MEIYTFSFNDCIYESVLSAKSFHKTKRGAYRIMNKYLNDMFNEEREFALLYGKDSFDDHIFWGKYYKIETFELKE